jgi:hypothetical protein
MPPNKETNSYRREATNSHLTVVNAMCTDGKRLRKQGKVKNPLQTIYLLADYSLIQK